MEDFGKRLKEAREKCRLSQGDVFQYLSIPQGTLSSWETNRNTPPEYVQILVMMWIENFENFKKLKIVGEPIRKNFEFKDALNDVLRRKGLTVWDAANVLHISRYNPYQWSIGRRVPPQYKQNIVLEQLEALPDKK